MQKSEIPVEARDLTLKVSGEGLLIVKERSSGGYLEKGSMRNPIQHLLSDSMPAKEGKENSNSEGGKKNEISYSDSSHDASRFTS